MIRASPELGLLLDCARKSPSAAVRERIRSLTSAGLDWQLVMHLATVHAVLPLLYWNLRALEFPGVPQAIRHSTEKHFQTNVARNLFLADELLETLARFDRAGVPALSYKGPALAAAVYGNLGLREFIDLDVLVSERDIIDGARILFDHGWRLVWPGSEYALRSRGRAGGEVTFVRESDGTFLDLHCRTTPSFFASPLTLDELLPRSKQLDLAGCTIRSVASEDLLVLLCMHASKHAWPRLAWITDVAELVASRPALDWEAVWELAGRLRAQRMLAVGLIVACEFLGACLPRWVAEKARRDEAAATLTALLGRALWRRTSLARQWVFQVRVLDTFRDRGRFVWNVARSKTAPHGR